MRALASSSTRVSAVSAIDQSELVRSDEQLRGARRFASVYAGSTRRWKAHRERFQARKGF